MRPATSVECWSVALSNSSIQRHTFTLYPHEIHIILKKRSIHYDLALAQTHELLLSTVRKIMREDLKHGVNLIHINYDRDENDRL